MTFKTSSHLTVSKPGFYEMMPYFILYLFIYFCHPENIMYCFLSQCCTVVLLLTVCLCLFLHMSEREKDGEEDLVNTLDVQINS